MVKNLIGSFSENLMEKSRNPFLGTYALVWLVRNWVIVYTLFNFDKELNMQDRIDFISCYFSNKPFLENLVINILWALGLLVLTYLLLNISRFIMNLSEKQVTPWIYKITDKNSVVIREEHNIALQRIKELDAILDNERKRRLEAEKRADDIEKRQLNEGIISKEDISEDKGLKGEISSLYEKLVEKNFSEYFKETAFSFISGGKYLKGDYQEANDFFISHNLVQYTMTHPSHGKEWKITDKGRDLFQYMKSLEE